MNTVNHPLPITTVDRQPPVSWTRIGAWLADAGRMLRRAPARLILLPFLPLVVEMLLQQLPTIGIVLSKLITPAVGAWILLMLHDRIQHGGFAPGRNLARLRQRRHAVLTLAILGVGVFGLQCLVAMTLGGPAAAIGLIGNDPVAMATLGQRGLAMTLASAALPMTVLFFVCPQLVLSDRGVGESLRDGLAKLRSWWPPVILTMTMSAFLLALALWQPAALLLLVPLGFLLGYAGWRDAFAPHRA